MTDQQLIAIAITLFGVAAGSLFNNLRISDSNNALNKRFDDLRDLMNAHHRALNEKFDRIEQTLTAVIGDHDANSRSRTQVSLLSPRIRMEVLPPERFFS